MEEPILARRCINIRRTLFQWNTLTKDEVFLDNNRVFIKNP